MSESSDFDARTRTDIGGGYVLQEHLARESFGDIYRAVGPGGFPATIRILRRTYLHEETQRELESLEIVRTLSHPFLLQTIGYWANGDQLVISAEAIDGSLQQRLEQAVRHGKPGIPQQELLPLLGNVAEALDYLHKNEVIHHEITPDTIVLTRGHAKLMTHALVRGLVEAQHPTLVNNARSLAFLAPEAWSGTISPRSNQYSLAAIYVHASRNRSLFPNQNPVEWMATQLTQPPDLADLSPSERDVLRRALERNPHLRYATCLEFVKVLQSAVRRGR